MGLLNGKVCIVTGAAGGIGSEIVMNCVFEGAEAVVAIEHQCGSFQNLVCDFKDKNKIDVYTLDLENEQDIKQFVQNIIKRYEHIDVLVNCAGVEYNEKIGFINYTHMKHMFSVNVFGLIEITQYITRVMMRRKSGSIINMASVVGVYGNPGQSVYSATKGAVIAFTKSASKELAPFGIRVNAIAPGITDTKMIKNTKKEMLDDRIEKIGLGRIATPQDIAKATLFLASENACYITGQIIGVDGGTII